MLQHKKREITKVLIVNRSEIALRLQATCHALGIKTVAIYAPEDADLSYVQRAHEAYPLSKQGFSAYTHQDEILTIAMTAQVDALHPGYGFLSENARFAQKVIDAGLIWIGPDPEQITLMGDKVQARLLMEKAGVPVVPGYHATELTDETQAYMKAMADDIGYPVILKDPLSGGGKAMKRVESPDSFDDAWQGVIRESKSLTNAGQMLMEKYLEKSRHIEVQVAGDGQRAIHLYERECSIQRRHQKIIEEAPTNFVRASTLEKMYAVAVKAAQAINYKSIGTIEFMVTPEEQFYFLEMNTRLQVEHSVTELTTGIDLVALQLEVARTGMLPHAQDDITRRGHALECRIYAEDAANNFTPSTGVIEYLQVPMGPFIRNDHDLITGRVITPYFDPMIAKITTFGINRAAATACMKDALKQFIVLGIKTNLPLLRRMLETQDFVAGTFHTQLLTKQYLDELLAPSLDHYHNGISYEELAAVAAALTKMLSQEHAVVLVDNQQPVKTLVSSWKAQQWS